MGVVSGEKNYDLHRGDEIFVLLHVLQECLHIEYEHWNKRLERETFGEFEKLII